MKLQTTMILAVSLMLVAGAGASEWGGHNGNIHLSFSQAPELSPTAEVAPMDSMGVLVDVHAVLADFAPLLYKGARILSVGGFELKLEIVGADDYQILSQTTPNQSLNISEDPAQCMVGMLKCISIKDGPATLVSWQVLIMGDAKNVEFRLAAEPLHSAATLEGCAESGTSALWSGAFEARQHELLFSAGYVPAFLNWEGDVDLTPRVGTTTWQDTGLFTVAD